MPQESLNCDAPDGTGCQASDGLSPCINNCGFLGCAATLNLCTNCYRELVLKQDLAISSRSLSEDDEDTVPRPASLRVSSLLTQTSSARVVLATSSSDPSRSSQIYASNMLSEQILASQKKDPLPVLIHPVIPSGQAAIHLSKRHTTNRCYTCQKRVGLLGFKCRCGGLFCATHRYSDKHACSFDYKAAGREAIANANPVVKAEKVVRL